ncbi:MAG: glutathione binding-like protein [Pseudomonadota bacterium]
MKLYGAPFSCALASNIVARELGVDLEYDWVQLSTKQTLAGETYTDINPKGKVPALVFDDGRVLTEGVAVMAALADDNAGAGLLPPPGSPERATAMEWLTYLSTELHKKIFYPAFNPHAPQEAKAFGLSMLPAELAYIDGVLANRDFVAGERFTPADAYLATILNWATFLETDFLPYPNLVDYRARVMARPAVSAAFAQEGQLFEEHAALRPDAK